MCYQIKSSNFISSCYQEKNEELPLLNYVYG